MKLLKNLKGQRRELPTRYGQPSGYIALAIIEDGTDTYVALTDYNDQELWIEKYCAPLLVLEHMAFEDLIKIKDEEEFRAARDFLIKQNII